MAERRHSGRGTRRRSGGDGEPDLFKQHLSEIVQQAFAATEGKAKTSEATDLQAADTSASTTEDTSVVDDGDAPRKGGTEMPADSIPARMLNEYVYCPRLFYYEHVEGVFVESADTVRGETVHARVDKGSGAMPEAKGS